MIKLIASDIDGTLVPDSCDEINPEYYDIILKLKEKGVQFVANSGRQFSSIHNLFKPIEDDIYYITDGGGYVRTTDELLVINEIPKDYLKPMIKDARMLPGCDFVLCGINHVYVENGDSYMCHWLRDTYKFNVKVVDDLTKPIDDSIAKFTIYHPSQAEELTKKFFSPKWQDKLNIASAGIEWMDCIPKTTDKGVALSELQQMLHISPKETMVFGDNINDIGLISQGHHSYAVANAREELKKHAKHVIGSYKEDGVLHELKKLLITLN